jgi:holo-[acyl-carrier protein] synthase
MIIGVGTDIIEVERIEKAAKKETFLQRVYTNNERDLFQQRNNSAQTMAANFAGKEAVAKALGTGFGVISWTDIEILRNELGKPMVNLRGKAREICKQYGQINVHISLAHLKALASAYVVIEGVDR